MSFFLPLAKGIVMSQLKSPAAKRLVIDILQKIVKETDNDLDDFLVGKVKTAMKLGAV